MEFGMMYRVEHKSRCNNEALVRYGIGEGPYYNHRGHERINKLALLCGADDYDKHPPPGMDTKLNAGLHEDGLFWSSDIIYGCDSMHKLSLWFSSLLWRRSLYRNGFIIVQYTGQVIHGHWQSVLYIERPFTRAPTNLLFSGRLRRNGNLSSLNAY